jgi:hypothetical protein
MRFALASMSFSDASQVTNNASPAAQRNVSQPSTVV